MLWRIALCPLWIPQMLLGWFSNPVAVYFLQIGREGFLSLSWLHSHGRLGTPWLNHPLRSWRSYSKLSSCSSSQQVTEHSALAFHSTPDSLLWKSLLCQLWFIKWYASSCLLIYMWAKIDPEQFPMMCLVTLASELVANVDEIWWLLLLVREGSFCVGMAIAGAVREWDVSGMTKSPSLQFSKLLQVQYYMWIISI